LHCSYKTCPNHVHIRAFHTTYKWHYKEILKQGQANHFKHSKHFLYRPRLQISKLPVVLCKGISHSHTPSAFSHLTFYYIIYMQYILITYYGLYIYYIYINSLNISRVTHSDFCIRVVSVVPTVFIS